MLEEARVRRTIRRTLTFAALVAVGCGSGGGGAAAGGAPGASGGGEPPALPVGVHAELREESYAVFGRTVSDIGRSLGQRGPAAQNRLAHGRHSWGFEWDVEWSSTPDGCAVDRLRIDMTSTIHMPRWAHRAGAPTEVQRMWDEYVTLLREHEERHRSYAFQAVTEIYTEVALMTAPTCRELSDRSSARAREIQDRYDRINRDFDARSAGTVRWPPR